MKPRKRNADQVAEELASLAQTHLATLGPAERSKKLAAFRRVVAKAGDIRAKGEGPRRTEATRNLSQAREAR